MTPINAQLLCKSTFGGCNVFRETKNNIATMIAPRKDGITQLPYGVRLESDCPLCNTSKPDDEISFFLLYKDGLPTSGRQFNKTLLNSAACQICRLNTICKKYVDSPVLTEV